MHFIFRENRALRRPIRVAVAVKISQQMVVFSTCTCDMLGPGTAGDVMVMTASRFAGEEGGHVRY